MLPPWCRLGDTTLVWAVCGLDIGVNYTHNQNIRITGYPTEKNSELLALLMRASSSEQDTVLDCFAGSGTTLDVADHRQRRWIGIDNSPEAIKTTLYRFANGTEPMGDFVGSQKSKANTKQTNLRLFPIKDFSLQAIEPYGGEIDGLISDWSKWVE